MATIDYSHAQMGTQRAMELGGAITRSVDHNELVDRSMQRERLRRELMQGQQFGIPMEQQVQQFGGGGFYGQQGGTQQQSGNPGTKGRVDKISRAVHEELVQHDENPRTTTKVAREQPSMTDRIEDHESRPESPTQTPADQQRRIYRDLVTGRVKMGGGSNA